MVNYQLGKIYRIVCNTTGKVYIGSTCEPTLAKRLAKHNDVYKQWLKGNRNNTITSFQILEQNSYEIILIENYPCDTKDELHSRERFFIENTQCVNKIIPTRTQKEYNELHHDRNCLLKRKYYEENKNEISENNKIHYKENKEIILERNKEYKLINKEKIKEQVKQYHEAHKEKIKEYKKEWGKNIYLKKKEEANKV